MVLVLLSAVPSTQSYAKSKSRIRVSKTKINCNVGDTGYIKPKFKSSKKVTFKYKSSNKKMLKINSKGQYKAKSPGIVEITIKAVRGGKTLSKKVVTIAVNGLCFDVDSMEFGSFIYKGKSYQPCELPLKTEKKLCKTQKDLKVYLTKYLPKYQKKISDPTEAALTAIMNYGDSYMKTSVVSLKTTTWLKPKDFIFHSMIVGTIEDAQNSWAYLLHDRKGACSHYSSLFSYLCYLSGVSCMQIEDEGHDWNLIYHPGNDSVGSGYYNLDNHYLIVTKEDKFIAPPFTKKTASIFAGTNGNKKIVHKKYVLPKAEMPIKKISKMGRNVSKSCPVLMTEKVGNEYRVFFKEISKGNVPAFSDGTKVTIDKMSYRNMELDADNDKAAPQFRKASKSLQEDISELFK